VRHGQNVNPRSARHCRRGNDHRAWPVLAALVLASIKFSSPQEAYRRTRPGAGCGSRTLIVEKGVQVIVLS
jgi:hypothetical protein